MAFEIMRYRAYPPRLWSLQGYPGAGKSTFATQMKGPLLPIDADHRFCEVLKLAGSPVYRFSLDPMDNVNVNAIAARLAERMPGAEVGTIVIDSLTAIISPLITQAISDKAEGKVANLAAAFSAKAVAMRLLQDSITQWGCDVLWIHHLQAGRDQQGKPLVRTIVSTTELDRLERSLNMRLEMVHQGNRRGIKILWARTGKAGETLWDDTRTWKGMPERIEVSAYGTGQ